MAVHCNVKKYSEKLGVWFDIKETPALKVDRMIGIVEDLIAKIECGEYGVKRGSERIYTLEPFFMDAERISVFFVCKHFDSPIEPVFFDVFYKKTWIVKNASGAKIAKFVACGVTTDEAITNIVNLVLANPFDEEVTFESLPNELTVNPCRIIKTYL